ncbi:DNA polymerase III, epsilon subunit [Caldithrix abyssi DSM 13497]|uniref:3'-5' exonuclease DinG n=1 Tax=Caldithrix abyssi DSM 13497 TaxID=880073 RepID=H1XYN2_CALAY|nr:helicase C-terminal domain-containing protein [Caldithrix abyssi]APF19745.1 ATP-dependent DNA helicase DinG [Caldithrix abyssi DSM 13497]EHO39850.1 DNA polymerase III, epsilon subunit [Caldithrix abyssi DSM 13497]
MGLREELLRHLGLNTFVVVDLETTGLNPEMDRIIEIGAIRFVDGKEDAVFEELIDPGIPIPPFITSLTGIRNEDVKGKPSIEEIFPRLLQFMGDVAMVGQQVNFDAAFLEYQFRKQKNDFERWEDTQQRFKYLNNLRVDTLFLARIFMPFLNSFKLASLASEFDYDLDRAHRAVDDARATGHVFLELIDRALAAENHVLSNIINLLYPTSRRAKQFFIPVLKFKQMKNISATGKALVDDAYYAQDYYNVIGEKDYRFPQATEEFPELEPIDPDIVDRYFGEKGHLSRAIPNYELRPPQIEMARNVLRGLNERSYVVAEAGTGTGKSMAYLVPAIEWAVKNRHAGQRVVVSTNTKNLQEQLFFKDLPTLYATVENKFKAVLLKGRYNYLCLEKWHTVLTDMNQRISRDERTRLLPLVYWVEQTRTGDIMENAGFQLERNIGLWEKLTAEPSYCPGKACKYYDDCFLMKAREHARRADVVVVNHALLFADLAAGRSTLGDYEVLVLDEAHNLEKTAAEYLGVRVNYWAFRNLYHRIYDDEPNKSGTIVQIEYRLSTSRNMPQEKKDRISRLTQKVKFSSLNLKEKTQIFYNEFSRMLRDQYGSREDPGAEETRIRYHKGFKYFRLLEDEIDQLRKALGRFINDLNQLIDKLNDLDFDSFKFQAQLTREVISSYDRAKELLEGFNFCLKGDELNYVYWLDLPRNQRSNDVALHAVPLNIDELLNKMLYPQVETAIFTSATLSINKSFDYFHSRLGLKDIKDRPVISAAFDSPFDYETQLLLAVTDFLPDPRSADFPAAVKELVIRLHKEHRRGLLILLTNYSMLNQMYDWLKPHFDGEHVLLLAQGKSGSRTNILNQFKENRASILLGTDSFWEGIDVPGDALELLFIPKLPFDVPSEPVIAARMEAIKRRGGNPFMEYSLPEAIIKFRQGFGRLIRHKKDFGAVIIGDNRVSRMRYGKHFLNSISGRKEIVFDEESFFELLHEWFKNRPQENGNDAQ